MNQILHDQSVVSTTDSAASDLRATSGNFGHLRTISGEIGQDRATLKGPMGFFFWQRKKQEVILKNENSVAIIIGTREEKKEKRILPNGLVIASSVISFQLHFRLLFNAPFNKRSSTLLSLFFSTFIHDQIIGYVFLMIRFHRDFA